MGGVNYDKYLRIGEGLLKYAHLCTRGNGAVGVTGIFKYAVNESSRGQPWLYLGFSNIH